MKYLKLIYLSQNFYRLYPANDYPEMLHKQARPYVQILVKIKGVQYAIPFRSNITHPYAFFTDKDNRSGIDFTKAVVITDSSDIDNARSPQLRQNEFNALKGKDYRIMKKFESFLSVYKEARTKQSDKYKTLLECSSLQYFDEYIGL